MLPYLPANPNGTRGRDGFFMGCIIPATVSTGGILDKAQM